MTILRLEYLIFTIILTLITLNNPQAKAQFKPPVTKAVPVVDTLHGYTLTDNYQWLEDKEAKEVKTWSKSQHQATLDYLDQYCPPIEGLKEELTRYIDREIISPLVLAGERQFYKKKKAGEAQDKLYTLIDGKEKLLFDPLTLDDSGMTAMTVQQYTKKGDKVAVGVQTQGDEISTYYILDTKTGKQIGAPIEGLRGFNWTKSEQSAYIYVRTKEMIDQQIPQQVYLHTIGTDRSEDQFLLEPDDASKTSAMYDTEYSDVSIIKTGTFYVAESVKILPIGGELEEAEEIYTSDEYNVVVDAIGDKIYIYTNHEADNYKLMVTDKDKPQFEHWKDLYPEEETKLERYEILPKYMLIQDKEVVTSRLKLYDLEGNFIKQLELPEVGNVAFMDYNRELNRFFVGISSLTAPYRIYEVDPEQLEAEKLNWKEFYEQSIPINTDELESKIVYYPAKDGKKVPLMLVYKKGMELDGTNPTLLYGYGGFNHGIKPFFVGEYSMFVNRGGVFAMAGIRGGDEYGESWHKDGMLHKKQNTFDDFIAAAEYLIKEKYTNTDKLAVFGGSNGGLLIGAVVTQRPELFKLAISDVPLLDMIRFHRFLIARYWIPEYGDVENNKADFQNILQYSPYHNVRMGVNLPILMVSAGENDSRVDALHAKKFVAAAQNNVGQHNPVLLYMDFHSGHGTGKSTAQKIEELDHQMRFIMNTLTMDTKE